MGVKPTPLPDPQSFQNPMPLTRAIAGRANPIMAKAQARARNPSKR